MERKGMLGANLAAEATKEGRWECECGSFNGKFQKNCPSCGKVRPKVETAEEKLKRINQVSVV